MKSVSKNAKWILNTTNEDFVNYVSKMSGLSSPCAKVLINRGIKTQEQIDYFLKTKDLSLSDPFMINGIMEAVDRIKKAKKRNERILVCGDYDADGLTATAIMLECLLRLSADVDYFIPHRFRDGYGLGDEAIRTAQRIGAKLIITVDNGISSFETLKKAKSLGIDVIVTDHHEPVYDEKQDSFVLPEAYVVINPKLQKETQEPYNLKNLSGAGLSLKLAQALSEDTDFTNTLLDLAAIGTSADVVSVLGENRLIMDKGLKLISEGRRPGIAALKEASGFKNGFSKNSLLHFGLNPRINAPGRLDDSKEVIKLFSTKSYNEAQGIAKWMCELNSKRQQIEEIALKQAILKIESKDKISPAIVVASENWHLGVVGIVASRLVDTYGVPSFVFTIDNGIAKGSARSNGVFDLLEGLKKCAHLIERFGGHKQAAGLSVKVNLLDQFREAIGDIVSNSLSVDTQQTITVDALLDFSEITQELVREISVLEPFGYCNAEPIFGSKLLEVLDTKVVGNNHLLMNLRQKGKIINSIAFSMGDMANMIKSCFVDILYMPSVKKQYNNDLQLHVKAIRLSA